MEVEKLDQVLENKILEDIEDKFIETDKLSEPSAVFVEEQPLKFLDQLKNFKNLEQHEKYGQQIEFLMHGIFLILQLILVNLCIHFLTRLLMILLRDSNHFIELTLFNNINFKRRIDYKQDLKNTYDLLKKSVIQILSKFLEFEDFSVKKQAASDLTNVALLLNEDDRGQHVLTKILNLAHDDENEQNRIVAVDLLSNLAPVFGKDLCEQFIGLEFLSLGDDSSKEVRQEIIKNLPQISQLVGKNFFNERLLRFFLKSCSDKSWNIRKACVQIFPDICQFVQRSYLINDFAALYIKFLNDPTNWVKRAAFFNLGLMIVKLEGSEVNDRFFDFYLTMIDKQIINLAENQTMLYYCAFYFPAVLQIFTVSKWPQLYKVLTFLKKSNSNVKKVISSQLHEIAGLIGPNLTEKYLIQILGEFLTDINTDIKYGAIKNLTSFLLVFDANKREDLIDVFLNVQKEQNKWRIRFLIAQQLEKLVNSYSSETVFKIISPISFKLCNDNVSVVRNEAAKHIHSLFTKFKKESPHYYECLLENLKGFYNSNRYSQRQTFIKMCCYLMLTKDLNQELSDLFLELAQDKIVNVRLCLVLSLIEHMKNYKTLNSELEIEKLLNILAQDQETEIKECAKEARSMLTEIVIQKSSKSRSLSSSLSNSRLEISEDNKIIHISE